MRVRLLQAPKGYGRAEVEIHRFLRKPMIRVVFWPEDAYILAQWEDTGEWFGDSESPGLLEESVLGLKDQQSAEDQLARYRAAVRSESAQ